MNIKRLSIIIILLASFLLPGPACAYWVWTPGSGKWENPKYAAKDTPEEQFDFAIGFYKSKNYKRAISEFQRLLRHFSKAELAPAAQYYIGRVYEDMEEYYHAFLAYQKTIDTYPFTEKVEEIVEREYRLGDLFLTGQKAKILGVAILPATDKAIEIFKKVTENAPYSAYAPKAQFKVGQAYKMVLRFDEAILEFQHVVDNYPESDLVDDAKYEIAYCTYKSSLKPHYDQTPTDVAIRQFEEFAEQGAGEELTKEAEEALRTLKEKKAESLYESAFFYERMKQYKSALIYYNEILEGFPDTDVAVRALARVKVVKARLERLERKRKK